MLIENIEEKFKAIQVAENCMHSVRTVNPDSVDLQVFVILNQLKMDLIDHKDEQAGEI